MLNQPRSAQSDLRHSADFKARVEKIKKKEVKKADEKENTKGANAKRALLSMIQQPALMRWILDEDMVASVMKKEQAGLFVEVLHQAVTAPNNKDPKVLKALKDLKACNEAAAKAVLDSKKKKKKLTASERGIVNLSDDDMSEFDPLDELFGSESEMPSVSAGDSMAKSSGLSAAEKRAAGANSEGGRAAKMPRIDNDLSNSA